MARESKLAGYSDSELRELGAQGLYDLGLYASKNGAWNALFLKPNGRLCDDAPDSADKPVKRNANGKRRGCLPQRLDQSINKALTGIIDSDDPAYIESPSWEQFKTARESQGSDWVSFIAKKLKGDKEASDFALWIESNDAVDKVESAASAAQQKALNDAIALIEANGGKVVWD